MSRKRGKIGGNVRVTGTGVQCGEANLTVTYEIIAKYEDGTNFTISSNTQQIVADVDAEGNIIFNDAEGINLMIDSSKKDQTNENSFRTIGNFRIKGKGNNITVQKENFETTCQSTTVPISEFVYNANAYLTCRYGKRTALGKVGNYRTRQEAVTITGTRKNGQVGTLNISSAGGMFKLNGQLPSANGINFEITPVNAASDDGSFNEISIEMSYLSASNSYGILYISSSGQSLSLRAVTRTPGSTDAKYGVVQSA